MISARVAAGADVLLLAPVRGLYAEVGPVLGALGGFAPDAVGLGISSEDLKGIVDYFVLADAEPVVPLTGNETSEVRGLVRFGEVRVPNPSFVEVVGWGRANAVPVAPLDPDEEEAANLFTQNIGYVELVRRTVAERKVGRTPPTPPTPDAYALAWDKQVAGGRGSRAYAAAKDQHLVAETRRLAHGRTRVAVVVDRERFDGVRTQLAGRAPGR